MSAAVPSTDSSGASMTRTVRPSVADRRRYAEARHESSGVASQRRKSSSFAARTVAPVAVRLGTTDAESAHARLRDAGATLHNDEVLRLDGVPAMFSFADPDGNGLVYLEESRDGGDNESPVP